jgi:thiamine pyrophosphokinase
LKENREYMKNICLLAGGPVDLIPNEIFEDKSRKWVGVDRGALTLIENEIVPIAAFGDFDSISSEERKELQNHIEIMDPVDPEKDDTDLGLAMEWVMSFHPETVNLYGTSGGRMDHFFGAIQLLYSYYIKDPLVQISLIDKQNQIQLFGPGTYHIPQNTDLKYVSFIPFVSPVTKLTLNGFLYPLTNKKIDLGSTLCISNEIIAKSGTFSFLTGILIMIRSND